MKTTRCSTIFIYSWDSQNNDYGKPNGTRQTVHHEPVTGHGTIRPTIKVDRGETGTTDIMNSKIAYLGYNRGTTACASGLSYYGGDHSIIKNNKIHDLYFGFYS